MRFVAVIFALLSIPVLSIPASAFDNWTFITRDQRGVVVEMARRSGANVNGVAAAVFRFRPTQTEAEPRTYAIAAMCRSGAILVAPAEEASTGVSAWIKRQLQKAAFRKPTNSSVGGEISATLCANYGPAPYEPPEITQTMPLPSPFETGQ
ncbi:hypothetical protein [Sphingomonas sp. 28-62-11]|uniref:hypothetical protein n=1 Tax=Sphingomonas sp. 28-62-11 TaxID=1970432 RepID=UPI000BDAE5C8|nr:MAG: hypothetical protein B7Y49_10565 [Sphingomonas sp. 28-62-11]